MLRFQVHVTGSVNVPLFLDDADGSAVGALKQAVAYGSGGFWLGARSLTANAAFVDEVRAVVPTSTPVLVACQRGLRSLSACEQLVRLLSRLPASVRC
jgi:rhodanese-related sulfurtransferase